MATTETVLKNLLKQQHLQEHRLFLRAYDRAASKLDKELIGSGPSKATFYRWLAGQMTRLPHPGHCRVLEAMLPGWTADELFQAWTDGAPPQPRLRPADSEPRTAAELPQVSARPARLADLSAVFTSRTEFTHELPPAVLFDGATSIRSAGLSLNMLCQQYGDRALGALLDAGCEVRLLFLRPRGNAITAREDEEGLTAGHLSMLTELNIEVAQRLRRKLSTESAERLCIRTYDETIRFNITIVSDRTCVVQPYLPDARGLDAPTFIADRAVDGEAGLYGIFNGVFDSLWDRAESQ
ncbi:hypothetical protein GCM10009772_25100 [Pseudonocardia alni subsp. carboxydivorans]|uniref:DUF5919 domain-containing protein n=1 Tax=Pseudonocardia alni subsp. carboxydivorans TaxID=415010 RepID=A0ABU9AJN8_PSEA5